MRRSLLLGVLAMSLLGCDDEQSRCRGGGTDGSATLGDATTGTTTGDMSTSTGELPSAGSTSDPADASTGAQATGPSDDSGTTGDPDTVDGVPLRVMTYNIKHGDLSSLEAIAEVILHEEPDIVALQEVDKDAARSNLEFQSYRLGQLTGMSSLFRQAIPLNGGGEYGLAVLSRFPIVSSEKVELTSGGEQRILVVAEITLPDGRPLAFANTHMGLDSVERATQATEIVDVLAERPLALLMGDFNADTDEPAYATFEASMLDVFSAAGDGPGETFPATAPDRRIDYIMQSLDWLPPVRAWVPETTASDHRPIVVDLMAPLP